MPRCPGTQPSARIVSPFSATFPPSPENPCERRNPQARDHKSGCLALVPGSDGSLCTIGIEDDEVTGERFEPVLYLLIGLAPHERESTTANGGPQLTAAPHSENSH